jgi:Aspartyl/Asparaginyl beta-hydroxylase
MIPPTLKLPFFFDPAKLKADAAGLAQSEWVVHFNKGVYEGDWDGVALRSVGGVSGKLYPDPMSTASYADTQILSRCPYIQEVLRTFHCSLTAARILRLRPGARIREHRDYNLGFEDGEVRVHIPIQTAPGVAFFLESKLVSMEEGEAWYLNLNLPHRVQNDSSIDRLHLVVDCVVNDWLTALFPVSETHPSSVLV